VTKLKPVVFAVLAGLPLAVLPAMAQTNTPGPAQGVTESTQGVMESTPSATATVPSSGAYTATSQSEHLPMTNHEDATGQTQGPIGGGASSGK
jgi:hypothetical protein